MIEKLPPEPQEEVRDFVEFLREKKVKRERGKLRLSWAGALEEFKNKYTSALRITLKLSGYTTQLRGYFFLWKNASLTSLTTFWQASSKW
ncbi:MAG TPA: hypothetical protein DCE01_02390 [Thermodesulfobacterium commune]|uniref:DUF2281 domain-containing protein n=1 Tax=Thermodesulfobacterium commune TaxID=1741 RepID=A0A3B8N3D4_9BACT|nr:hypothetical protein [Thermodesulfobacterium commune]